MKKAVLEIITAKLALTGGKAVTKQKLRVLVLLYSMHGYTFRMTRAIRQGTTGTVFLATRGHCYDIPN